MSEEYTADQIYWMVESEPSKWKWLHDDKTKFVEATPYANGLIDEFLEDLHDRDYKRDCEYRCGGKPGEPCKSCTNYKHCDDNNYPIIEKWEAKKNG